MEIVEFVGWRRGAGQGERMETMPFGGPFVAPARQTSSKSRQASEVGQRVVAPVFTVSIG